MLKNSGKLSPILREWSCHTSCSIFHKLSGITSISMLYIEHTSEVSKQRKTLCFPLFLNLISMLHFCQKHKTRQISPIFSLELKSHTCVTMFKKASSSSSSVNWLMTSLHLHLPSPAAKKQTPKHWRLINCKVWTTNKIR